MASASLTIPISEDLKAFVEARVDCGSYGTPSEYIRELILNDRDRRLARLEDDLIQAAKGPFIEVTEAEWESGDLIEILRAKVEPVSR